MRVGIDASNIQSGGGMTHLVEMLEAADPEAQGIERVTVWGGDKTLERLPRRPWLSLSRDPLLNGSLPRRYLWQHRRLPYLAAQHCDVLFVPGGLYIGGFHPFVTMSQNLLPFSIEERRRFGFSPTHLRYLLLERGQSRTFRRAQGVIFLTETARNVVTARTGPLLGKVAVIPHGVSAAMRHPPRPQRPISSYSFETPFRLLYVSIINLYKHQWHVVDAVGALRAKGYPVALDLVGPASAAALPRLQAALARVDPHGEFIHYLGPVPYSQLSAQYRSADAFVFASSCENMPNILVEAMSAGLPIASSNRGPMPEMLGEGGVYFDPEAPDDIRAALSALLDDPALRDRLANLAYQSSQAYSWERCAGETLRFVASCASPASNGRVPDILSGL